jgi:hypothetical protein
VVDARAPVLLTAAVHRAHRGYRFDYTVTEDALVRFKIQRRVRRHGHVRWARVATLSQSSLAGRNAKRWPAKVHGRRIARGRYRAILTAFDAAGNRSAAKRLRFAKRMR